MKRVLGFLFGVLAILWMAAPAAAWNVTDSEEPGSVLVFPKFIRGMVALPDRGEWPVTQFEISATCPNGANPAVSCPQFGPVELRAHWVCPQDTKTNTCQETDFDLFTSIDGTVIFDPEGDFQGNAVPPCPRGYLLVWVIDPVTGSAIKFDGLIGDAVIRESATSVRAYNAIPIQAATSLNTGDFTDVNGNGALDFDGNEYQPVTGKIYGSIPYGGFGTPIVQTSLTLLTLDVASGMANPTTYVPLSFFSQFENLTSAHTQFTCWEEVNLTDIDSSLDVGHQGLKGLVQSDPAVQGTTGVTLLGLVESAEGFTLNQNVQGVTTITISTASLPKFCKVNTDMTITCNVPTTLPAVFAGDKSYTYPLFNDSMPVATTFFP